MDAVLSVGPIFVKKSYTWAILLTALVSVVVAVVRLSTFVSTRFLRPSIFANPWAVFQDYAR